MSGAGVHFGGPIEEKVSDLGGLEGLESLEMHGFSGLEGVSDVIRGLNHFGSPIEEKVSDLGGLESLESLENFQIYHARRSKKSLERSKKSADNVLVAVCKLSVSITLSLLKVAMFAYDPSRCLCVMCCGVLMAISVAL